MSFEPISVKMDDPYGVIPKLRELARTAPKECEKAQLRAASIMPRKITAAMRSLNLKNSGGKLPALSDLSTAMRDNKPGGKLTSQRGLCRIMNINGKLVAGFVGNVANVAANWQDGGTRSLSIYERRYIHIALSKRGARGVIVPTVAQQPKRLIVEPLAVTFGKEMPKWILGALNKEIDKKMKGAHK